MPPALEVLLRGRWAPGRVVTRWADEPFALGAGGDADADAALAALASRGSPSHDGWSARLARWAADDGRLRLDVEPIRWSARLLGDARGSFATLCLVRTRDGRWLAGRRAPWVGVWPGRWLLGAGGAIGRDEDPVEALPRELGEEWSLVPEEVFVTGIARVPGNTLWLLGLAVVGDDAQPVPDDEHDDWAWWPADPAAWPEEAGEVNRTLATSVDE